MNDETRIRFLSAIAKQVPAERVAEVHLFGSIRQGGVESGVAVVAVDRESATVEPVVEEVAEANVPPDMEVGAAESERQPGDIQGELLAEDAPAVVAAPSRYTVYSARYRYTLKGLDRGKWEVNVTEQADAPLLTIDAVVRGVQRRSGDVDDIMRFSGDEFRAALPPATVAA